MQQAHHTSKKNGKRGSQFDLYGDLEKIKAAIAETTGDAKGKAQEALLESLDHMQEKYFAAQDKAAGYVGDNPFKSVAITFAAGAILGFLMRK